LRCHASVLEHVFHPDYQNCGKGFVKAFIDYLANWEFATSQVK